MDLKLHRLTRLSSDNRGTGALELALALPMLMMLLVGMIDISRYIANRIDVEQAAIRTTEYALAIRPTDKKESTKRIITEAVAAANADIKDVSVEIFLECDGTKQTDFSSVCADSEDQARFVSVSIKRHVDPVFDWPALAGALGWNIGTSEVTVTGDSIVRFQ